MTEFAWIGLQVAEHWRGLGEIAAAMVMASSFVISSRSGLSRR